MATSTQEIQFTDPFNTKANTNSGVPDQTMTTSTSTKKREKLVPKLELTLKGLVKSANGLTRLSPIAASPISSTTSNEDNFLLSRARTPRTPSSRLSVHHTPHSAAGKGISPDTPRYTVPFGTSPRTPHTPRSAAIGLYSPRTPRRPSAIAWEREHGFLPVLPERCQSVPVAEDWMPEPDPSINDDVRSSKEQDSASESDSRESTVEEYDNDYEYEEECDWGDNEQGLTKEEYTIMLEEMREAAELSVCEGMMEQMELRDFFEQAVDEMTRVRPEPERFAGLRRRRTIG
ncbi:hypothetical protein BDP27DRAFT_1406392 [Rhodocollybia butyracea]|uniref:Uncharacterized protein n=1 Tax=Rhodocollybia butyracea TaxID=206335 RepID=A0A9P5U0N8_9AGAR|nr:hypothetical protein BDP27DRAFT_1406392 [Rhodocollybia butyracea]